MSMYFQSKVFQLLSSYIPKFDVMVLKIKLENINISHSQKWKVHTTVSLCNALSEQQDHVPLRRMTNKLVMEINEKHYCTVSSNIYGFA